MKIITMKKLIYAAIMVLAAFSTKAQTYTMQRTEATEIRAISGNYFIYFTLADMKEAFLLLPKPVQDKYTEFMDLPIGIRATINIVQGSKAQASIMERVLMRHTGGYLLKKGLAYIETKEGKKVKGLDLSAGDVFNDEAGFEVRKVTFYNHDDKRPVFTGTMDATFK
jgi:hypothetical protein